MGPVDSSDASAALKAWAAAVQKEQNLQRDLKAELVTQSITEMTNDYVKGTYDGIAVSVEEFLQTDLHPEEIYAGNRGNGPFLKYALIVSPKSSINDAKNLIGKKIVTSQSNQMNLAELWLTTLLSDEGVKESPPTPYQVDNLSKAILEVFFGQADAALVTTDAFELARELNPQVGKKMRILAESPPIIPVFFIFQPNSVAEGKTDELAKALLELHKSPGGLQVLTVIQSQKMEKYPFEVLQSTIDLIKKYQTLVNS